MRWKGFRRGLDQGMEGSGFIYGIIVPLMFLVFIIVLAFGTWKCVFDKPEPLKLCTNYSFDVGYINKESMTCTRWPAMEMEIEERMIKADIVHCKCTQASFPPAETIK